MRVSALFGLKYTYLIRRIHGEHTDTDSSGLLCLTIPELEQSKGGVLNTLASVHSRRSYEYAIERFIAWYCDEPRLGFNRPVVVRYRSFLESLSLSAATINLHLTAIRRLADEAAESGWLSPELVTGIRRVKGVKRLGRRVGNWLTGNQAQELLNAVAQNTLQGKRDRAMLFPAAQAKDLLSGAVHGRLVPIAKIVRNKYDPTTDERDIALVKVATPITDQQLWI